ncbi:hypothetical protein [Serratia entomophila]|uniref:hypothetical protein n=1 Tax=Serratia entomophila TaxID=42906 RepID=UPI00217BEB6A|nr:hypothetical protein [Serratia entomophila]CAI0818121.1 phage lysis regulatory protein, LysB family [Serratia entomophila]CAI0841811.1 phage lysis regulatory protein, LysB family [Serratia entomophila]CAI0879781.1 phage lysis regulatory protein, LysB family [Serratia entomophila]CAI1781124.1 phage lysis regulatory protein, LysB family [Serratia entomophila]CAI1951835.1 phage lysis regulatory protein, LysB family [Serratia entomophila]
MDTSFSFRTMAIGLLLVALIVVGRLAFYFHGNAVKAGEQVKQQEKALAQQSGLITTLQTQDAQNRALVAAQQQHEQQLRQQHDILQRKYREAIKNDPCAAQPMPAAVVELLQQNTAVGARTGDKPTP